MEELMKKLQDLSAKRASELLKEGKEGVYRKVLQEIEKPLLETILHRYRFNQVRTAKMLGMSRNTLRSRMKRYNLS